VLRKERGLSLEAGAFSTADFLAGDSFTLAPLHHSIKQRTIFSDLRQAPSNRCVQACRKMLALPCDFPRLQMHHLSAFVPSAALGSSTEWRAYTWL
jgi:hypothetical protein